MKSRVRPSTHSPCKTDLYTAAQLLSPTLRFLVASGLEYEGARQALEIAWIEAKKNRSQVKISQLNGAEAYREIISRWTSNPEYLDQDGNPRVLPVLGRRSFSTLARGVDKKLSVPIAIDELRRFGNLRRRPGNKLKLLKSFLHVSSDSAIAFEPHFEFLASASMTVSSLLSKGNRNGSGTGNFWRMVEELELPSEHVDSYLSFIRHRSLSFLQEIDEWLRAHSSNILGKSVPVRAGLGLFTFHRPGP